MEWVQSRISNLGKVFDTMVELTFCAHASTYDHSHSYCLRQRLECAQQGLSLVSRAIFIYGHEDVFIAKNSSHSEQSCKDIRYHVERVVQVDGKEVLVV